MPSQATTYEELREARSSGACSPTDAVEEALAQIEARDHDLNAFVEVRDRCLEEARLAEGPLAGVPIAVKDMFVDEGRHPSAGSNVPAHWLSGTAEILRRLRGAGGVVVGYTNLHEWALATTSAVTATGPIHNPWDRERVAGGSSGGSAAALAAGMAAGAIGTDAGGSIRVPAACCGVVGFKPTWGSVPVDGYAAGASPTDHIGPMARSVGDVRSLWRVLAASPPHAPPSQPRKLHVGVARRHFFADLEPEVARVVEQAIDALADVVRAVAEVEVTGAEEATGVVASSVLPHTAALLSQDMVERLDLFQPETQGLLLLGAGMSAADQAAARRTQESLRRSWERVFEEVDIVLTPTLPAGPARLSEGTVALPSGVHSADLAYLSLNAPMNAAGIPALALPVGETSDGWSVSVTLSGRRGSDEVVLATGEALEDRLGRRHFGRVAPAP